MPEDVLLFAAYGLLVLLGLLALLTLSLLIWTVVAYAVDITQTRHTVRRNFPVIGRFRYFFEHLGEFFRQYFFAMDREEMPFNRAERAWAYKAAKKVSTTIAFGSTRRLDLTGTVLFVNSPFPGAEAKLCGAGRHYYWRTVPSSLCNPLAHQYFRHELWRLIPASGAGFIPRCKASRLLDELR